MIPRTARTPILLAAVAALATAALSALLPACQRSTSNDDRPITLELWTLALNTFKPYITGLIADFEAQHPGVRVNWVDVPYAALDRKLIAAAAAGRAPDVINYSDMSFARFAALGAAADLTPHLPIDADATYLPGVLTTARLQGRLLALPWYLTTQTLIINEPLLAAGGFTPDSLPTRFDELRDLAAEFHERTGTFLFSLPLGEESNLAWMMLASGVVPFTTDAQGNLAPAIDSPEVEAYLRPWVELYRAGHLPREAATSGHAHLIELYKARRIALMNASPNFLKRIRDEAPSVFTATTLRSSATEALGRTHVAVMLVSVTTQSEHPDLAARLAAHLTSPAAQLEFCRIVDILPSTTETLADPFFHPDASSPAADESPLLLAARTLSAESLATGVAFTPSLETWPDLRRAFEDRMKRVLLDDVPLERALADLQREWSDIFAAAGSPADLSAIPRPDPTR